MIVRIYVSAFKNMPFSYLDHLHNKDDNAPQDNQHFNRVLTVLSRCCMCVHGIGILDRRIVAVGRDCCRSKSNLRVSKPHDTGSDACIDHVLTVNNHQSQGNNVFNER